MRTICKRGAPPGEGRPDWDRGGSRPCDTPQPPLGQVLEEVAVITRQDRCASPRVARVVREMVEHRSDRGPARRLGD
eukprot:1342084-Prymnesium_polylepis.1